MYIFRFFLTLIFFFSCNTEPIRKEIIVGKTIKIEATNFGNENLSKNYNFLWSLPASPNNLGSDMSFKIENDKMLFTPFCNGDFDIVLTIESLSSTSLYEEVFSYHAIDDGSFKKQEIQNTMQLNVQETLTNNNLGIKKYTIQVAARPSIEQAKKYQQELREKGFDAYTESIFTNNKQLWRIRVGNFTDYDKGKIVEQELKSMGYDTWFTNIKE